MLHSVNKALRWLTPLCVLGLAATPLQAGVALDPLPLGNPLQPDGSLANHASADAGGKSGGDEFATVSQFDVVGAKLLDNTHSYQFTFGPDANLDHNSAAGTITFFNDEQHDATQDQNDQATSLQGGLKGNNAVSAQPPLNGAGGNLLSAYALPHGLPSHPPSNAPGGQVLGGSGIAGFSVALDRLPSGMLPIIIGHTLTLERETLEPLSLAGPSGVWGSGVFGGSPELIHPLPLIGTGPISFNASGIAPLPGSLTVWGLIGLVLGGAWWRHRRRLLALA